MSPGTRPRPLAGHRLRGKNPDHPRCAFEDRHRTLLPLSPAAAQEFERLKRIAHGSSNVMPTEDGDAPSDPKLITRVVARNLKSLVEHGVGAT